jgi:RNA polymerase sigma-70 factor (ECF subfamily)
LTRNETEAADLTQQTFLILAQRSHQIKDVSKVKCWLFTTLRREFLRIVRSHANHPHQEFQPDVHDSPSLPDDALRALDAKAVVHALAAVEPTYRTAVELSYKEIAETLDVPIGTVMSRLSRGKEQLKALLAEAIAENNDKIIPMNRDEEAAN